MDIFETMITMFIYHKCLQESDLLMNGRLPLSKLTTILQRFNFEFIGEIKEYWIHTIQIVSNKKTLDFFQVNDIDCNFENDWICQECKQIQIPAFHFYQTDTEEIYNLYEVKYKQLLLRIQVYPNYFLLKIVSESKLSDGDMKLFYII
tara:strand:- start:1148 stop:1591 length:444 start_codon:yes stop_codon:yes gene_type:complete